MNRQTAFTTVLAALVLSRGVWFVSARPAQAAPVTDTVEVTLTSTQRTGIWL